VYGTGSIIEILGVFGGDRNATKNWILAHIISLKKKIPAFAGMKGDRPLAIAADIIGCKKESRGYLDARA